MWTEHGETPDMVFGRLREAAHISSYAFERACEDLAYLLTGDRWQHVGAGYTNISVFLREAVDLSAFNVKETRPELIQLIKELQPEASNRAIADALGVSHQTVMRDVNAGPHGPAEVTEVPQADATPEVSGPSGPSDVPRHLAPAEAQPVEADEEVSDDVDEADAVEEEASEETAEGETDADEADGADVEDEPEEQDAFEAANIEDLPTFLWGDDWLPGERRQAYVRYLGLPPALQPTVADLLAQPGICVPDIVTMLEHIAGMDAAQQTELARLRTSADAYERSCAITMTLDRPPPPHPCLLLVLEVQRELGALSARLAQMATRYADLPGAPEVIAWGGRLSLVAGEAEAVMRTLQACKEGVSARRADVSAVV